LETKALVVTGPFGSGKARVLNSILRTAAKRLERFLVIVPKVPSVNKDVVRIEEIQEMNFVKRGCIGYEDTSSLLALLAEARGMVNTVFIELRSDLDALEFRESLLTVKIPRKILCLYDCNKDYNNLDSLIRSQLKAADAVALVNLEPGNSNGALGVIKLNAVYANEKVFEIPIPLEAIDDLLLPKSLRGRPRIPTFSSKRVTFHEGITLEDLAIFIASNLESLYCADGVISGRKFSFFDGFFELGKLSEVKPFGKFSLKGETNLDFQLLSRAKNRKRTVRTRTMALKTIDWLLTLYGKAGLLSGEELRVDWDADLALYLAFEEEITANDKKRVINEFVDWRLKSARFLQSRELNASRDKMAYWKRRLGVILSIFAIEYSSVLGKDSIREIFSVKPIKMLADGLLESSELFFNEELIGERPESIKKCLRWGITNAMIEERTAKAVITHCCELTKKDENILQRWLYP